ARLRDRWHPVGVRQELPRAELPRVLPARLPAGRRTAPRITLGSGRHPDRRARGGDPRLLRALLRPPPEGHLARAGPAAPVPGAAPLRRPDPAPARPAAENPAQHRGPGPGARPRPRSLDHGQADPRAMDGRADRLARPRRPRPARSAAVGPAGAPD